MGALIASVLALDNDRTYAANISPELKVGRFDLHWLIY